MHKKYRLGLFPYLKIAFACAAFSTAQLFAAPVSPDQALKEVKEFHNANSVRRNIPAENREAINPSLAYTASYEGLDCFYVFNNSHEGGFTIVTADDRLPAVLGFTYSGDFDFNRLSPEMKWWLGEYEKQISAFLGTDPQLEKSSRFNAPASDKPEIKPLLTSKWNQTAPYNDDCPMDPRTHARSVTGCVATAMAQVMRHHKWPIHPTGTAGSYIFTGSTLEWDLMLDSYSSGGYTSDQAAAVALLSRQCGAAVNMQYSSYESGAYSQDVPVGLTTYFDYDKSVRMEYRDYYTMRDWNNMVYNELENNRPVYYSGRSSQGGHAFVVDGYLGRNYFHLNWGWGGYQDGYFLLNALNPSAGGTGSYAGGYNSNQMILTNVMKNIGTKEHQILVLSTGNFEYTGSNTYKITNGEDGIDLMYNACMYSIDVTFGLKIVSRSNPENVTYVKGDGSTHIESLYGTDRFTISIPRLADGTYEVYPAVYTSFDKWEDVMVPINRQRFVTLEVSGGKQTFLNEGPMKEQLPKLIASVPENVSPLYANVPMAFKITVMNVGKGDYDDNVYLSLYKKKDPFAFVYRFQTYTSIPSGASVDIEFSSSDTSVPGDYTMYFSDEEGEDIFEPIEVTLTNGNFSSAAENAIKFNSISPSFMETPSQTGVIMIVENTSDTQQSLNFKIKFLRASDKSEVTSLAPESPVIIDGKKKQNLSFAPRTFNIDPGYYYWVAETPDGKTLSKYFPVVVTGTIAEENDVYYQTISANPPKARIVSKPMDEYTGAVSIPDRINGYIVTEIKANAFTFSEDLESLRLPSDLRNIYPASFYASGLKRLDMGGSKPPYIYPEAFAPEAPENIVLSSETGDNNLYHNTTGWNEFKMSSWNIEVDDALTITGLKIDPSTGKIYNPYYVSSFVETSFVAEPNDEQKVVKAEWTVNGSIDSQNFWRTVRLPALAGEQGTVVISTTTDSGIDTAESNTEPADVYSLQGMLLIKGATPDMIKKLPAGIYISNGKKLVIR